MLNCEGTSFEKHVERELTTERRLGLIAEEQQLSMIQPQELCFRILPAQYLMPRPRRHYFPARWLAPEILYVKFRSKIPND